MKLLRIAATALGLSLGPGQVLAQHFKKGLADVKVGDFEAALADLLPLAEAGNADAQFGVGAFLSGWNWCSQG